MKIKKMIGGDTVKQLATKKAFWLLTIPALAIGIFILAQGTAVYAKGSSGFYNHDSQNTNHGQMMKDHWKDPELRIEMQNMMREHHSSNWQTHHQQMHGSDSEP